jgi:hypothetical protein
VRDGFRAAQGGADRRAEHARDERVLDAAREELREARRLDVQERRLGEQGRELALGVEGVGAGPAEPKLGSPSDENETAGDERNPREHVRFLRAPSAGWTMVTRQAPERESPSRNLRERPRDRSVRRRPSDLT